MTFTDAFLDGSLFTLLTKWQKALSLDDWHIGISPLAPDDADERSSVTIDRNQHNAVIRFDLACPEDQFERQLVHELLHVRLAELQDAFMQVQGDDASIKTWWHRSQERTIEAFVALLVGDIRRDYRGGPEWTSAVYPKASSQSKGV